MYQFVKRRRRQLLASAAVGVAGAALAYYCYSALSSSGPGGDASDGGRQQGQDPAHSKQEDEEEAPTALLTAANAPLPAPAVLTSHPDSLDESMSSHFEFIQGVSTPQELEQLLPQMQAVLNEMTDVQAALAALPAGSAASVKLHVLAQHSLGRSLAGIWIIPLVDLLVRAKLNVIGRHLFLEEKLAKLRLPAPAGLPADLPAARLMAQAAGVWGQPGGGGGAGGGGGQLEAALPPQLQPESIEAFLPCSYFAAVGCRWLVSQVLQAVGVSLSGLSLDEERSPTELAALLQALHGNVAHALALSLQDWPQLLLGPAVGPPATGAAGPQEGETVGRQPLLLCGRGTAQVPRGPPAIQQHHPGHGDPPLSQAHASGASPVLHPEAHLLAPPPPSPPLLEPVAAGMLLELQRELRRALGSAAFDEAVRASVTHALRCLIRHALELFPTDGHPAGGHPAGQPHPAGAQGSAQVQPTSTPAASSGADESNSRAVRGSGGGSRQEDGSVGPGGVVSWSLVGGLRQALGGWGWQAGRRGGGSDAGPVSARGEPAGGMVSQPPAPNVHLLGGSTQHELHREKPPRKTARLLRPVQQASDKLFGCVHDLSQGAATLGPVLSLSASIFAAPAGP